MAMISQYLFFLLLISLRIQDTYYRRFGGWCSRVHETMIITAFFGLKTVFKTNVREGVETNSGGNIFGKAAYIM